jgi:Tfp pilus assembly protein PilX
MEKTKKGAVSLYVVIFATLLLSVITLSFVRIMLKERSQSSNDDISQSAFDSALAGIEDAKLAIMRYNDCLSGTNVDAKDDPTIINCTNVINEMNLNTGEDCDIVSKILGRPVKTGDGNKNLETTIQESDNTNSTTTDEQLDQAYTCVRISNSASDFLGRLDQATRSRVIPLRAASEFDQIVINWSTDENYGADGVKIGVLPEEIKDTPITYFPANWPSGAPPVIEVQLVQTPGSFELTDFDMNSSNTTNRATAIVVPVKNSSKRTIFADSFAKTSDKYGTDPDYGANGLYTTGCVNDVNQRYHCSVIINLPAPLGGGSRDNGQSFLRLAHVYANDQDMDYQIILKKGSDIVSFAGVQAVVDSTGRTSDMLRRVESRIELIDVNFPYPEYAVELGGGGPGYALCKSYQITKNNWISGVNNLNECN